MVPVPENMENNSESESAKTKKRKANMDNSSFEVKKTCVDNNDEIFNSTHFKFLLRNPPTAQKGK